MPESSGSTGAEPNAEVTREPSFDAVEAAARTAFGALHEGRNDHNWPLVKESVREAFRAKAHRDLSPAYAIDAPAIHAAGRAEGDARFEALLTHVHRIDHIRGPQDTCRRCAALRLDLPDTPEGWRAAERGMDD